MPVWKSVRKSILALVLVSLVVGLTACGSRNQAPTPAPPPAETPVAEIEETEDNATPPTVAATGLRTFRIVPEGTEARFHVDEVLLGEDKTVIGVTSLVTGELAVDPADPSSASVGVIQIDARDFTTDNNRRNASIRRYVLQSARDEYQYIVFEPTALDGLPATVAVGEPFEFSMTGNLTIRDVTHPATFTVTVTPEAEDRLVGLASSTVTRGDYGLTIPSVPGVANVGDEVLLELQFTAVADD